MQALRLKIILFIGLLLTGINTKGWAQEVIKRADSLFAVGAYANAGALYQASMANGQVATDGMLLKLAYISEKNNDVPRLLYYLQVYFDRHPKEAILQKMNDIARVNGLNGYETDDLNYFYLFYKQYGIYLFLVLLVLGAYVFGVLLMKTYKREEIPARHKWVVLLYLFVLLLFVNLPEGYQSGIISRNRVFLRPEPSSAAPVAEVIGRGHKVNILGGTDIWLRVFWNDRLYFVRKDDVWVI